MSQDQSSTQLQAQTAPDYVGPSDMAAPAMAFAADAVGNVDDLNDRMEQTVEEAEDATGRMMENIKKFIEEKPLESIAVAFLAGLTIQRLMR